jgi:putative ABC transport system permease protein
MVSRILDRKITRDLRQLKTQVGTIALLVLSGLSLMIATRISYDSLFEARYLFYRNFQLGELFAEFQAAPWNLKHKLADIPGVASVDARLLTEALIEVPDQDEPAVARMISIPADGQPPLNRLFIRKGRLPVDGATPEVLIHEAFAAAHSLALGERMLVQIKGQRARLKVVGIGLSPEYVYALHAGLPLPDDQHFGVLWLSQPTLARLLRLSDSFNSLVLRTDGRRSIQDIRRALDRVLSPYGKQRIYDREGLPSAQFVEDELVEQRTMSIISPLLFLSIAVFIIHVILSRLIHTHRPQIAVLKALGYGDGEIVLHYAKLIIGMMLWGTLPALGLGVWLGQLIVQLYERFFRFPDLRLVVDPWILLLAGCIGLGSGLFGGLSAIRSILRLSPAEALKPPIPPLYQALFLDKFNWSFKLGITKRMTWRYLMLRPQRLALTLVGMAAAMAMMVSSGSLQDMIHFLLNAQFQHIQREDLQVALHKPISVDGLQEIGGLPGVLRVEGYRLAAVRIHFKQMQKETVLLGWPENAELQQRLDAKLRPVKLPSQGIFLSRYFQKHWHLRPGDAVDLQVLKGSSPILSVRIAGFTDDLIGTSVHMRLPDLWSALREEPGYNVFCLKVDPFRITELYARIRQLPLVATVSLRSSLAKGFFQSMGGLLQFSTSLLIAFAFIIAAGLIYNSVLMNFSERSRDMATLKVLGFEHPVLFFLLLDSVLIQLLSCLLPGAWLGYQIAGWLTQSMRTDTLSLPTIVQASSYAIALATMLLAFLLSAWSLHRMLAELSLTEALKAKE